MQTIVYPTYVRISKRQARKLHATGANVHACPRKLRPGGPFASSMAIPSAERIREGAFVPEGEDPFDYWIKWFNHYNASWEAGYYPAFYIERQG